MPAEDRNRPAILVVSGAHGPDIERELAVGVQGPGVLHVVFVANE